VSDKNFLNIHVLISHSPSCLNRDDMNMQKSAVFGGVRRVRISSQSLKQAMRSSDYYAEHIGQASIRTRELGKLKHKYIEALNEQYSDKLVTQAIEFLSGKGKDTIKDDTRADAVAPWTIAEVAHLCGVIQTAAEEKLDAKKLKKLLEKESQPLIEALSKTPDIALSGRMATSGLMTKIDGALSLAHTITTHAVDVDTDWFSAIDDLILEEGDVGSGHLSTQEFGAGVFYRYASLNIQQLQKNLGNVTRTDALQMAQHLTHLLATVVPNAKQRSFAAHNLADLVLVSFGDMPISMANAFEKPVKAKEGNGFLQPSIEKLEYYWEKIYKGYGLNDKYDAFCLWDTQLGSFNELKALETWVANNGKGN
jgi:CRISPR system Cascade subunit CasC